MENNAPIWFLTIHSRNVVSFFIVSFDVSAVETQTVTSWIELDAIVEVQWRGKAPGTGHANLLNEGKVTLNVSSQLMDIRRSEAE